MKKDTQNSFLITAICVILGIPALFGLFAGPKAPVIEKSFSRECPVCSNNHVHPIIYRIGNVEENYIGCGICNWKEKIK